MNFGTYDEQQAMKRYIISLLVKQALSDDDFSNIEKKYLVHAARSLQLSDTEVAAIRHAPDDFDISPPPDESQRMTIFYYLLFMMRADQKVTPEEEQLCYQIGFKLGFRQDMISNFIKLMKEYLVEDLPPDAMLERVKPYLN
ncbi:MAG TPA: TerB family tellurite resistance protein [Bacteroidetes bacterium]|nr:TerB family tellurite resistance protein [Bacteroidota bacterium]